VLEGVVVRQRVLRDGRCQTLAIYQRDDVVNLDHFVRKKQTEDNLIALRGCVLASVEPDMVEELRHMSVTGIDGMAALLLRELGINQERLTCLGQKSAIESLAHFLCETLIRSQARDFHSLNHRCSLAMTQEMLSETLGISAVHVNRTLQAIRRLGLADLSNFELLVQDYDGLAELGEFDPRYLAPV